MGLRKLVLLKARFVASKSSLLSSTTKMDWDSFMWLGVSMWRSPQSKIENRTVTGSRFQPDSTTVAFHNFLNEGEPNTGTFFLIAAMLQAFKYSKYFLMKFKWNPDAIVFYIEYMLNELV